MKRDVLILLLVFVPYSSTIGQANNNQINSKLNVKLAQGWNTWNTRSVLSHVLLPDCFSIDIQLENIDTQALLSEALIGRRGKGTEKIKPGPHTYDGAYTDLDWYRPRLYWGSLTKCRQQPDY